MSFFHDVVLHEGNRVRGEVINWTLMSTLPREITYVNPNTEGTKQADSLEKVFIAPLRC
jgi:ribulose 1,5-bisphosphate synthetase/thiazole synthase